MGEPAWDYDSTMKRYGGPLNCRWGRADGEVVLEPIVSFWTKTLTGSALLASLAFLVGVFLANEICWRYVLLGLAIVFPCVAAVVGRAVDRYEQGRGRHLVFTEDGRILLPRFGVEIRPDETTEFRCHEYDSQRDAVEDLVLHHGGKTYYLFSGERLALQTSVTEKLCRELEEQRSALKG